MTTENTISSRFIFSNDIRDIFKDRIKNISENYHYFWLAIYNNKEVLSQFDENGNEIYGEKVNKLFDDYEKGLIKEIWLIPLKEDTSYGLRYNEKDRLILFRRGFIRKEPTKTINKKVYSLGYQRTENNKNEKEMIFVLEDGSYIITDDFNKADFYKRDDFK